MAWSIFKGEKYVLGGWMNLKNRLAYRAELFSPLLTYGLFVSVFQLIWTAAYAGRAELAGYSRFEVTWYFAMAELAVFLSGGFFQNLSEEVKSGQIAYTLGRPYSFTLFQFSLNLGPALAQLPLLGLLGYGICTLAVGPLGFESAGHLLAVVLSFLLSLILQFALQLSLSLAAFWVEETVAFYWVYQKIFLVTGTLMPLEFLPDSVSRVLVWTPFPYLTWAPAKILVHYTPEGVWPLLGAQAFWVLAASALAAWIFRLGVRRTVIQGG